MRPMVTRPRKLKSRNPELTSVFGGHSNLLIDEAYAWIYFDRSSIFLDYSRMFLDYSRRFFDFKRLAEQNPCLFFRNGISAARSIMNRLFVVVLCRFSILVRVEVLRVVVQQINILATRTSFKKPRACFFASRFSPCKGKPRSK